MAWNPPETREEIRDTLFFMGIPYVYEKLKEPRGHVYFFELPKENFISIYSPNYMKFNKKTFKSPYDLKREIMRVFAYLL